MRSENLKQNSNGLNLFLSAGLHFFCRKLIIKPLNNTTKYHNVSIFVKIKFCVIIDISRVLNQTWSTLWVSTSCEVTKCLRSLRLSPPCGSPPSPLLRSRSRSRLKSLAGLPSIILRDPRSPARSVRSGSRRPPRSTPSACPATPAPPAGNGS